MPQSSTPSVLTSLAVSALLSASAACDNQATPDYLGEPLLAVQGSITTITGEQLDPSLVPAIGWFPKGKDSTLVLQDVAVKGEFPANFKLSLLQPPPDEVVLSTEGVELAWGHVIATVKNHESVFPMPDDTASNGSCSDQTSECDESLKPTIWDVVKGLSDNYLVLYTKGAAPAGSMMAAQFNGGAPIDAGMHLVEMREFRADEERQIDACFASARAKLVAEHNRRHGTAFTSFDELERELEAELDDFAGLDALYEREEELAAQAGCPISKVYMRVVDVRAQPSIAIKIAPDLDDILDWH